MRLVRFKVLDGPEVLVNPEHVVSIEPHGKIPRRCDGVPTDTCVLATVRGGFIVEGDSPSVHAQLHSHEYIETRSVP